MGKLLSRALQWGSNLKSLPTFIDINKRNYEAYKSEIASIPGIRLFEYDESSGFSFNFQYIVLEIDEGITLLTRDEIVALLTCENISARRYFYPGCHGMQPYRALFPHAGLLLPNTISLCKSVVCLPTGTGITIGQIHQIGLFLKFLLSNALVIKGRIAGLPYPLPMLMGCCTGKSADH